jgi:hypothetical protein
MSLRQIEHEKRAVLANEKMMRFLPALKGYKYVDELQDMQEGTYVRWVHLDRRKLTNGAFLVRVDIRDDGIYLLMRNGFKKMFSVWADECLVFQKIGLDERVMLTAMNHVY